MAQGVAVPLRTENGRLKLMDQDDYIQMLLKVALGEGDSENPFQSIGLGEFMIFDINDGLTTGEIREGILQIFKSFELDQLARIADPDVDMVFNMNGAEKTLDLTYTNMETQERVDVSVPIPPAS